MKHSIKRQFALIFILLMTSVIFLCWMVYMLFLEKYYLRTKTEVLYQAYRSIKEAGENNSYASYEFRKQLEDVCNRNNIAACVMDDESKMQYVSTNGGEQLQMRLYSLGLLSTDGLEAGVLDAQTLQAVARFQEENGLEVLDLTAEKAVVDAATVRAIFG